MSDTTVAEPKPLPPPPPNSAVLASITCADRVHVRLKLNYDVTNLHADRQRLLLHFVAKAVKEMGTSIAAMPYFDVKKALDQCVKGVDRSPN